jgi:multidrug efflux pump subunit AcrA (membrane-fusion protein)
VSARAFEIARTWIARLSPRRRLILGILLPTLLIVATFVYGGRRSEEIVGSAKVRRGPLHVTISVAGTLAPARAEIYGGEIPGAELKILDLAPEGEPVEADALLIRFDDGVFRRELDVAQTRRITAESEAEQARQAYRALSATEKTALSEAEAALERAELDLKTFVNGAAPLAVAQAAGAQERARREAEDARIKFEELKPFAEKGYISREELRTARLRSDQAAADLALAESQYQTLLGYSNPQLLAQKTADLKARRLALENLRQKGSAQVAQARAAMGLAAARASEAGRAVAEVGRRIDLCGVRARSKGLVVYREIFDRSGERRRIRIGDTVFAGQPVLELPDLTRLELQGRVAESDIHLLVKGQRARIRLDAFPDGVFDGRVVALGSLTGGEKDEVRSFPLRLQLLTADQRLRPGMTARAEIECAKLTEALLVPLEAVRFDGDRKICLVEGRMGSVARVVTIGLHDGFLVEIRSGVREGETVLISRR